MERPDLRHVVVLAGSAGAFSVMLPQLDRLFVRDESCLPDDVAFRAREAATGVEVEPNVVYFPRDADDVRVEKGRSIVEKVIAVLLSGAGQAVVQGMRVAPP